MNEFIYSKICKVFRKHSGHIKPSPGTQMCLLWSIDEPPDILENTEALNELEKEINFNFDEEEAVEIFDMNIIDATEYIEKLISFCSKLTDFS